MKEREFIRSIQKRFDRQSPSLIKGIGDDCAVFSDSGDACWLVTTDLLVDDVHFVRQWQDAYTLGRKSIAVNLSDIAAMGGNARFALISLASPSSFPDSWLESWLDGVQSMLDKHDCLLIGGDTARSSILTINIMVIGSAECDNVVYRSGARPGDDIYITGPTGLSSAGLELLKDGREEGKERFETLVRAHFDPQPRMEAGRKLGASGYVSAMQDLSDGLATDLSHISSESGTGAVVYAEMLPVDRQLKEYCVEYNKDPFSFMLSGGEDYELVFTADRSHRKKIEDLSGALSPFYRIGTVLSDKGAVYLEKKGQRREITYGGFEHSD